MAVAEELRIEIEAGTAGLQRGLSRADQSITRFANDNRRRVERFERSFQTLGRTLLTRIAPIFAGGALTAGVRRSISDVAQLADVSERLGLAAEDLQVYRFAAQEAGVAQQTLDLALQRFTRRLGEAQAGTGELLPVIEQYGIELKNADGTLRSSTAVLEDYADAVRDAGTDQERLRLAFKAFDSEGAALVTVLKQGSDGLRAYRAEAERLGVVLDEQLVQKAGELDDTLDRLSLQLSTGFKAAVLGAIEQLGALDQKFRDLEDSSQATGFFNLGEEFGSLTEPAAGAAEAVDALADATDRAAQAAARAGAAGDQVRATAPEPGRRSEEALARAVVAAQQRRRLVEEIVAAEDSFAQAFEAGQALVGSNAAEASILSGRLGDRIESDSQRAAGAWESYGARVADTNALIEQSAVSSFRGFEDALVSAVTTGEAAFGRFTQAILADLTRILVRTLIVQPIVAALTGGGGGFATALLPFAQGGMRRGGRAVAMAAGGVVSRPTVLFGEGAAPAEAFVPLPDGRSIPVTMTGGGGGVSVTYNINAAGAEVGVEERIRQVLRAETPRVIERAKAETARSLRTDAGFRRSARLG